MNEKAKVGELDFQREKLNGGSKKGDKNNLNFFIDMGHIRGVKLS